MRNSSQLPRTRHITWLVVALLSVLPAASWPAADIVAQIVTRCPAQPRSCDQVTETLRQLAATSSRVNLEAIGYSAQGRPLWLVRVTEPESPEAGKMRLFIIARQHGNEPA